MARPKGSKNKNKPKDNLDNLSVDDILEKLEAKEVESDTTEESADEVDERITPITELPELGIAIDKYGYLLYERKLFKEDTITTYPKKGVGMVEKMNPAGSFSNWDKPNVRHFPTPQGLSTFIRLHLLKGRIKERMMRQVSISLTEIAEEVKVIKNMKDFTV